MTIYFTSPKIILFPVESGDFKNGVNALAQLLQVTPHPDHLVTLRALSRLVSQRLTAEALENPDTIIPKVRLRVWLPYVRLIYLFTFGRVSVGSSKWWNNNYCNVKQSIKAIGVNNFVLRRSQLCRIKQITVLVHTVKSICMVMTLIFCSQRVIYLY